MADLQRDPAQASPPQPALDVQLLHADSTSRVVLVRILHGGHVIDAALGEATTAEEAEDRARARLQARQGVLAAPAAPTPVIRRGATPTRTATETSPETSPEASPDHQPALDLEAAAISASQPASTTNATSREQPQPLQAAEPRPAEPPPDEPAPAEPPVEPPAAELPPAEPDDWSSELARLDLELRRLGWDRNQEGMYLERAFGHPSRSRLTNYGDLLAYLQALEGFAAGSDPSTAPPPLRRRDLLQQCDQLLSQLRWDPSQGRALLEQHFARSSRQQLSDSQLLQFNMLLESELMGLPTAS